MSFFRSSPALAYKKIDATVAECEQNLIKYSIQHARLMSQIRANPSGPMLVILRSRLLDVTRNINVAERMLKECSNHRSGISAIVTKQQLANLTIMATDTIANTKSNVPSQRTVDRALAHFDDAPGNESHEIGAAAEAYLEEAPGGSDSAISAAVDEMIALAIKVPNNPTNRNPPPPAPMPERVILAPPAPVYGEPA